VPVRHRRDSRWRTFFFGSPGEKLLESSEPKCPCKAVGDVVELPLPRRSGFQSALLAGGLETAAPCVGVSRPHSPLASHHQLRARRRSWPRPWWRARPWRRCRSWGRGRCGCRRCRGRGSNCGSSSSCRCWRCGSCGCSRSRWRRRVSSCGRGSCCGRWCRRWRECSCWTRSGRGRRSWAGWREIDIALSASRRTTGAVAEVLSKERVVSLHSGCGRCVAISHCAVDHVKA